VIAMFFNKPDEDPHKAVEKIAIIITGSQSITDLINLWLKKNHGHIALWKYIVDEVLVPIFSVDVSKAFAGQDLLTAKERLNSLLNQCKSTHTVAIRIVGLKNPYLLTSLTEQNLLKLKKALTNYGGAYDAWFDFDLENMIKIAAKPKPAKIPVRPLSANSTIWKSMEAIVNAVTRNSKSSLEKLRGYLSKGGERAQDSCDEQVYWDSLLRAIDLAYANIGEDFAPPFVIGEIVDLANQFINQGKELNFADFFVPDDVGSFKALAVLAEDLLDRNILLGWLESPDEKNVKASWDLITYNVLLAPNENKTELEKLFADCGGAVHFDFSDPVRLAAPLKESGVKIKWGGPWLPNAEGEVVD
jgi:hypothetical protein